MRREFKASKVVCSVLSAAFLASACGTPAPTPFSTPAPTPGRTIHLVALGDSTPAGYGVVDTYVDMYAEYLEADLGVAVSVHNWARGGQHAAELLVVLQENEALRKEIRGADAITIWTGMNDLFVGVGFQPKGGVCGPWEDLDMDCVEERVERLKGNLGAVVAEVLSLCNPEETLVLMADVGNPHAAAWLEMGLLEALKASVMDAWIDHIAEVAEKHGIQVVHTYRVLNGPDGEQGVSPEMLQDDGLHFNSVGHRLLADLHRQVGYGPLGP